MALHTGENWYSQGAPFPSKEVLVVDDDPDICIILQDVLEAEGCRVMVAHNGQEALQVLEHKRPALILLDLMMPVMDGWEFSARLQQLPELQEIPVVVVSADADATRRKPAARVVAAVPKPFDIGQIAHLVQLHAA
jgi:CheY-like chemotaxis protein